MLVIIYNFICSRIGEFFLHQSGVGSLLTEADSQVDLVKFNLLKVYLQRTYTYLEDQRIHQGKHNLCLTKFCLLKSEWRSLKLNQERCVKSCLDL